MSLNEFAAVATVGQSVSFIYHGFRRTGKIAQAIIPYIGNDKFPSFGNITIDEKKDGFRCFDIQKMSEINIDESEPVCRRVAGCQV